MKQGRMTVRECRACLKLAEHTMLALEERLLGTGERFDYFRCLACRAVQIVEPPALERYYGSAYRRHAAAVSGWRGAVARRREDSALGAATLIGAVISRYFPHRALESVQSLGIPKTAAILDVGCGSGTVLRALRRHGYRDLTGVDPFRLDADISEPGLSVSRKDFLSIDRPADLIMFHHSFEHLPAQEAALHHTAACLNSGGRCLLRMPWIDSFGFDHFGDDWIELDPPRHLLLHTMDSFSALLSRTPLELESHSFDSTGHDLWGSEQWRNKTPFHGPGSLLNRPWRFALSPLTLSRSTRLAQESNRRGRGSDIVLLLRRKGARTKGESSTRISA